MNIWPLTLEGILRSTTFDKKLELGFLRLQLIEAARRLWPEFEPEERKPITGYPAVREVEKDDPDKPFVARWRKWIKGIEDGEDSGI